MLDGLLIQMVNKNKISHATEMTKTNITGFYYTTRPPPPQPPRGI